MTTQDPYQQHPGSGWQPAPVSPIADAPTPAPYGQPVPAYGSPATGAPAYGAQAGFGAPAYGAPAYGSPAFGAPAYGAPAYGSPGFEYPGFIGSFLYAHWIRRVGAYLLDSFAWLPYQAALIAAVATSEPAFDRYGNPTMAPTSSGLVIVLLAALLSSVLWGWNRYWLGGRTGQSWGKKALGMTMQDDRSGLPIGFWVAFGRDIAHYVDGFFYLGFLWPLWDVKRQTFADKIVKSVVVR